MASWRWLSHRLRGLAITMALSGAAVASAQSAPAVAVLTAPPEGASLFGPVNIIGTAYHPAGINRYTLEYDLASEPGDQWVPVQEQVAQQVQDGVLGTWNTSSVPDGVYRLRLQVYLDDGTYAEANISNLRVRNSPPTPVPTSGAADLAPGAAPPTPGPSPTSPIVQPPSSAPQPGSAPKPGAELVEQDSTLPRMLQSEPGGKRVNLNRVQQAFCTGSLLGLGIFAIALIYRGVRRAGAGGSRPGQRDGGWQSD